MLTHLPTLSGSDREFTGQLRQLLVVRDQHCRTPYCDAAIGHTYVSEARQPPGAGPPGLDIGLDIDLHVGRPVVEHAA